MKIKPYDIFGMIVMMILFSLLLGGCSTVKQYAKMRAEIMRDCQPAPWGMYQSGTVICRGEK